MIIESWIHIFNVLAVFMDLCLFKRELFETDAREQKDNYEII